MEQSGPWTLKIERGELWNAGNEMSRVALC